MDGDDPIAVDLYVTRADAEQDLAEAIGDVPEWEERLRVGRRAFELDDDAPSLN